MASTSLAGTAPQHVLRNPLPVDTKTQQVHLTRPGNIDASPSELRALQMSEKDLCLVYLCRLALCSPPRLLQEEGMHPQAGSPHGAGFLAAKGVGTKHIFIPRLKFSMPSTS